MFGVLIIRISIIKILINDAQTPGPIVLTHRVSSKAGYFLRSNNSNIIDGMNDAWTPFATDKI